MTQGQEMFYNFFMERVKENKKEEAESLLEECFAKQETGTFDREYLERIMPKLYALVKPEGQAEVKEAMEHFSSNV